MPVPVGPPEFAFKTYVVPAPPQTPTGATPPTRQRAAALASCKKRAHKRNWSKKRLKECKRRACYCRSRRDRRLLLRTKSSGIASRNPGCQDGKPFEGDRRRPRVAGRGVASSSSRPGPLRGEARCSSPEAFRPPRHPGWGAALPPSHDDPAAGTIAPRGPGQSLTGGCLGLPAQRSSGTASTGLRAMSQQAEGDAAQEQAAHPGVRGSP